MTHEDAPKGTMVQMVIEEGVAMMRTHVGWQWRLSTIELIVLAIWEAEAGGLLDSRSSTLS